MFYATVCIFYFLVISLCIVILSWALLPKINVMTMMTVSDMVKNQEADFTD